jgi:methyl-accepting chemotaxis protein
MSSTSTEIAATVNQHERTASQQAAMVNETTTTIQELGASSKQTSEQASSAAEVAQRSLDVTGEGMVIVKQAMDGMNTLGDKVGIIADQILKLGEQTAQIGNLANMVKDLSGEINMLALNAAVEAARAGEHGKGFAVVAGEVRKLANESKKSAEEANAVIADIQKATNATILRTEEGTRVVEEVTAHARNVGGLFKTLSEAANSSYENAQQVLLNARQQATAIGQVVEAMNGLNTGARETAAGIIQTKTGIEQLNVAAGNLKQIL